MLSHFSHVRLFVILWTATRQAPLSIGFFRQEYWSGLLFPPLGIFPIPGSKPCLLGLLHWQVGSLPLVPPGKPPNKDEELQNYYYKRIWLFKFIYSLCNHVLLCHGNMGDFLKRLSLGIFMNSTQNRDNLSKFSKASFFPLFKDLNCSGITFRKD